MSDRYTFVTSVIRNNLAAHAVQKILDELATSTWPVDTEHVMCGLIRTTVPRYIVEEFADTFCQALRKAEGVREDFVLAVAGEVADSCVIFRWDAESQWLRRDNVAVPLPKPTPSPTGTLSTLELRLRVERLEDTLHRHTCHPDYDYYLTGSQLDRRAEAKHAALQADGWELWSRTEDRCTYYRERK